MGRARTFDNQDILERATRLFWRQGYKATSMNDLVETTGLAKASLYNAFGTKQDLFRAVLTYYIEQKQTYSLSFLEQGSNGREALEAYFGNLKRVTEENCLTPGCLLVNTATEQGMEDQAMRDIVDYGMRRTERHLKEAITSGIEDGSIDATTDPALSALCLLSTVVAVRVMARKGVEIERVDQLIQANLSNYAPINKARVA